MSALALASLLCAVGCPTEEPEPQPPAPSVLSVEISEAVVSEHVQTVVTVQWAVQGSVGDVSTWLEYGEGGDLRHRSAGRRLGYGTYEAFALGIPEGRTVGLRAVVTDSQDEAATEAVEVELGELTAILPPIDVPLQADEARDGFVSTALISDPQTAIVLDSSGNVVWAWPHPGGEWGGISRVALSVDGESVLYSPYDPPFGDAQFGNTTELVRVRLDGTESSSFEMPGAHHDFVELPDGKLAFIVVDMQEVEGVDEPVCADQIVETEADGSDPRVVWEAWGEWPMELDEWQLYCWDWTHANAIDYDPDLDAFHVSLRNLGSIISVDRDTGAVLRVVGGTQSDYELDTGGTELFKFQHQFETWDDTLLVFDNRDCEQDPSRLVLVELDDDEGTAVEAWVHEKEPGQCSGILGSVTLLPSQSTVLATWSTLGVLEEIHREGHLLRRIEVVAPHAFGYSHWYDDLTPDP